MAFVVTDACIACKYTDCVSVCPVDAFHEGKNFWSSILTNVFVAPYVCPSVRLMRSSMKMIWLLINSILPLSTVSCRSNGR